MKREIAPMEKFTISTNQLEWNDNNSVLNYAVNDDQLDTANHVSKSTYPLFRQGMNELMNGSPISCHSGKNVTTVTQYGCPLIRQIYQATTCHWRNRHQMGSAEQKSRSQPFNFSSLLPCIFVI